MQRSLWTKDIPSAKKIQESFRHRVRIYPLEKTPLFIAAVDAAYCDNMVFAAATLYKYPELTHMEDSLSKGKTLFPYIPGLLTFREGHVIIRAIKKLKTKPDLILFDGQGIAHPKGIGIASHIGVVLNIPTVGCAKSRLIGDFREPAAEKGSWTYLFYKGLKVGAVLRTRDNVKPLFVSPGHMTDIRSSVNIVMKCVKGYRIPEPLRRADHLSKIIKTD